MILMSDDTAILLNANSVIHALFADDTAILFYANLVQNLQTKINEELSRFQIRCLLIN